MRFADRLALRPKEAAAVLGISERTLRVLAPELPRVTRGGCVLYPVEALREWLRRAARAEGQELAVAVEQTVRALARDD